MARRLSDLLDADRRRAERANHLGLGAGRIRLGRVQDAQGGRLGLEHLGPGDPRDLANALLEHRRGLTARRGEPLDHESGEAERVGGPGLAGAAEQDDLRAGLAEPPRVRGRLVDVGRDLALEDDLARVLREVLHVRGGKPARLDQQELVAAGAQAEVDA